MTEVKISTREDFFSLAEKIKNNKNLNPVEKLILFTLYSYKDKELKQKLLDILINDTSLSIADIKQALYCLTHRGWLQIKDDFYIIKPTKKFDKGQKIAHLWSEVFGSMQLTPYNFNKIMTYIDDGLEEDLIIRILKISADNAGGNPLNYCYAILTNLLNKNIYTLADYYQYREKRGDNLAKQISTGTKKDKKRMERQTLSELYQKGYQ